MNPLRVGLDARLISGVSGGVEQALIGLVSALSDLRDGDEEYFLLVYRDADLDWLRPYVGGACLLLPGPPRPSEAESGRLARTLKALPLLNSAVQKASEHGLLRPPGPPLSDGAIEAASLDVMHFTTQHGFLTEVPSLYQPWDLQHVHLPQFFTARGYQSRELNYRALCEQARLVVVASTWNQRDFVEHFQLPHEKVAVIPVAPVLDAYPAPVGADMETIRRRHDLPENFIFYPAQTWPHKNHIGLLESLALLRERDGLTVPLVSSGRRNEYFPTIEQRVQELKLESQVRFLDFVSPLELQCLYRLCRAVVFPTKFEGWGLPLTEAFLAGAPVACSNVTSLPVQAGEAALLFDPDQPAAIAAAVQRLWTDDALREVLHERGRHNVARFNWAKIARLFRAHYRRIAGRTLTDEDASLLAAEPLV